MLKPKTPGKRSEETNLQLNPQLETVCEEERAFPFGRRKLEFTNMQISNSGHLEKVFKNIKKKVNLAEDAPPRGSKRTQPTLSAPMKAAIHMGPDYIEILEISKNTNFEELQNLFDITQKLVLCKQGEVLNVNMIECASL